ncbi:hypothetical protein L7F22_002368 [Adiantum nelumboides]|nr:hypothetical protein [Adiantum nelumboides]
MTRCGPPSWDLGALTVDIFFKVCTASCGATPCINTFGDNKLVVDLLSNKLFFEVFLLSCMKLWQKFGLLMIEPPNLLHAEGFSVSFGPLDGSSLVVTNFIVGTIFESGNTPRKLKRLGRVSFSLLLTCAQHLTTQNMKRTGEAMEMETQMEMAVARKQKQKEEILDKRSMQEEFVCAGAQKAWPLLCNRRVFGSRKQGDESEK